VQPSVLTSFNVVAKVLLTINPLKMAEFFHKQPIFQATKSKGAYHRDGEIAGDEENGVGRLLDGRRRNFELT